MPLSEIVLAVCVWFFCGLIAQAGAYAYVSDGITPGEELPKLVSGIRVGYFLGGCIALVAAAFSTSFFKHGLRFR